jgi:hypothetical protein
VGARVWLGKKFDDVFKGSEMMAWLLEKNEVADKKACKKLCNELLKKKFFSHVSSNALPFTGACFYRWSDNIIDTAPIHGSKFASILVFGNHPVFSAALVPMRLTKLHYSCDR